MKELISIKRCSFSDAKKLRLHMQVFSFRSNFFEKKNFVIGVVIVVSFAMTFHVKSL